MSRHFDYCEDPHERTALEISTLNKEATSLCSQCFTWVSSLFSDSNNQTTDSTDVPWTVVSKDGRTIKEVKFDGNCEEDNVIVDLDLEEDDVIVDLNSDADCVENGSDVAILDHYENTTRHDHSAEVLINLKVTDDTTVEAHRQASSPGQNSHLGLNLNNASMGSIVSILEYSKEEWGRSDTPKAQLMKRGYLSVFEYGLKYIRVCRGDNYCAVRSAIYQVLSTAIVRCVVAKSGQDYQEIVQMNQLAIFDDHIYNEWSFANRLTINKSVGERVKMCLKKFYELIFTSDLTAAKLDEYLSQDNHDVEVMEAVKVKMMLAAVELFERFQLAEEDLPMFSTILFVRDTSRTPHQLFRNHLNVVGDSGGLEQIEMFLLAHTLGVTIRAFRLQQYGKADFITYYNDEGMAVSSDVRPVVNIISEDDRHYNIVLTEEESAQYRG